VAIGSAHDRYYHDIVGQRDCCVLVS